MISMSRKLLIIEDETFIAKLYKEEMERHGVEITIAADGQEGVQCLQDEHFDLILLDLLMPVMDGYGVLEYVKKQKKRIPVVVITNLSEYTTGEKCRALGAQECLCKSDVDAAGVWEKVKHLLPAE